MNTTETSTTPPPHNAPCENHTQAPTSEMSDQDPDIQRQNLLYALHMGLDKDPRWHQAFRRYLTQRR